MLRYPSSLSGHLTSLSRSFEPPFGRRRNGPEPFGPFGTPGTLRGGSRLNLSRISNSLPLSRSRNLSLSQSRRPSLRSSCHSGRAPDCRGGEGVRLWKGGREGPGPFRKGARGGRRSKRSYSTSIHSFLFKADLIEDSHLVRESVGFSPLIPLIWSSIRAVPSTSISVPSRSAIHWDVLVRRRPTWDARWSRLRLHHGLSLCKSFPSCEVVKSSRPEQLSSI